MITKRTFFALACAGGILAAPGIGLANPEPHPAPTPHPTEHPTDHPTPHPTPTEHPKPH